MFVQSHPERVVIRISGTKDLGNIADRTRRIRRSAMDRQHGTGRRQSRKGPSSIIETIGYEWLVEVSRHLHVSRLHTDIGDLQTHRGCELAFDGEVPVLRVHVVEIWIDCAGTQAEASDGARRILQGNRVGGGVNADGYGKRRIAAQSADNIRSGTLAQDRIGGANGGLAILKGIPRETDARFEVLVVGVKRVTCWNQGTRGEVKIGEAAHGLRRRGIPFVPQADVDGEVRLPFETILREYAVGWLQRSDRCRLPAGR
jgi:hypothetical protein